MTGQIDSVFSAHAESWVQQFWPVILSYLEKARDAHTATALPDGSAVIVGGQVNDGQTVSIAELYDPGSGVFTPAQMVTGRCCQTATLLNSGQVLIAGALPPHRDFPTTSPAIPPPPNSTIRR